MSRPEPPRVAASAAVLALLVATAGISAAQGRDDGESSLRVEVSGIRNARGTLDCGLFTDAANFPDGVGARAVRAVIEGARAVCVFDRVPPGTYAVAVLHDENGNGRLDRNFLGIPAEGYGVSNNRTYAMSSPRWDESRFTIAVRERAVLRVSLRY